MKTYKDELGKVYGDFRIIAYTAQREPTNGCVKWLCECTNCGNKRYINGNNLRFKKIRFCQECNSGNRRKT